MPNTLYESAGDEEKTETAQAHIVEGTVVQDQDLLMQGKVLVRIPSLDQEVWARLAAVGAGPDAGFYYTPRVKDEVLVALSGSNPGNAYIIGGLWSTKDSPPVSNPLEVTTKRIIKTGLKDAPVAHQIEFDDGVGQSITIQTSTDQKITLDPFKIEITNKAGTLTITMDNKTQKITLQAIDIELSAVKSISLKASQIKIGETPRTVNTAIKGARVDIN
jgi:uncharacterized protein involved in type VI secretion and phage assembly